MTTVQPETEEKTPWYEKRTRRFVSASSTQFENFDLCKRKWWLSKVRGLADPTKTSQVVGTVLHSVVDRYLSADSLGRGPDGNPVDLYPPGWEIAKSRFDPNVIEGIASPGEQEIVKKLVEKAIEEGVLERRPGRMVESNFRRTVIHFGCPWCRAEGKINGEECPRCHGDKMGTHVQITGFIDCCFEDAVHDHKTVKAMKWAKNAKPGTENFLGNNLQMLIYAKEIIERAKDGGKPVPAYVTLRHNQFCKDPDDLRVRKVEVQVSTEDIERNWARIEQMATEMVRLRDTVDNWHQIPEPPDTRKACNAYGGCSYVNICTGRENPEQYEIRVRGAIINGRNVWTGQAPVGILNPTPFSPPVIPKETPMAGVDFNARIAAKAAQQGAQPPAMPPSMQIPIQPQQAPQQFQPQQAPQPQFQPQQAPVPQMPPSLPPPQLGVPPQPIQAPMVQVPVQQVPPAGWAPVTLPPWARQDCTACNPAHKGFNTKGAPCTICDAKNKMAGTVQSEHFTITATGRGTALWVGRDPSFNLPSGESPLPQVQEPQAQTQQSFAAPQPQQVPQMQQAPQPQPQPPQAPQMQTPQPVAPVSPQPPQTPAQQEQEESGEQTKGGRPRKGFILCINALPSYGEGRKNSGRFVHRLEQVLLDVGAQLAKANGVSSFYELDAFRRRDLLGMMAEQIATTFGADIVAVSGIGNGASDLKALCDAILPYAGMTIHGQLP